MVPGKLGFSQCKRGNGFAARSGFGRASSAAAHHGDSRRSGHVNGGGKAVNAVIGYGKPASGIKKINCVIADIRQLEPFHRTVIGIGQRAFIIESQRSAAALRHGGREADADGAVLGNALGRKRLAFFVQHLGHAQAVVQVKAGEVDVFKRREFHLGARRKAVGFGHDLCINHVVISLYPGAVSRKGRQAERRDQANKQYGTSQGSSCDLHVFLQKVLKGTQVRCKFSQKSCL